MEEFITTSLQTFPSIVIFLIIALFLWVLGKGADTVVDEAVDISISWGIPKIVIGSTIVSLGTTLPEASVSVMAAVNGQPGLALGNAIGSIIADTGLILGLAILLGSIPVTGKTIRVQSWIQFSAVAILIAFALPYGGKNTGTVAQWMGMVLVALLVIYIGYSIISTKGKIGEGTVESAEDLGIEDDDAKKSGIKSIVKMFLGIITVILSSKILIPAVQIAATRLGIPESVIGATLVAFGTSLPELVTSVTAVKKGHGQLAIGNVIGADILNVLFVIGASASVSPQGLSVPSEFYQVQVPFMALVIVILRVAIIKSKEYISKSFAYALLGAYLAYLAFTFLA